MTPRVLRLAYVVDEDLKHQSGVSRKVHQQVAAWRNEGHTVHVVTNADGPGSGVRWHRKHDDLWHRAMALDVDLVYARFASWVPSMSRCAGLLPVVLEINGDDIAELAGRHPLHRIYHRLTRGRAHRMASALITPSVELSMRHSVLRHASGPVSPIANGIDLRRHIELPSPGNERPTLGFTYTSTGAWTGVDDVIELAAAVPEMDFIVVGPVPQRFLPKNVTATGYLTGPSYDRIMGSFDVGIGSLAMFRARLNEGSTLKVRGYLAAGIPVILGHVDTDFRDGAPFILPVPNEAGGVLQRVDAVRDFAASWAGRRVNRADILHLDTRVKEKRRLDLLERIVSSSSTEQPR